MDVGILSNDLSGKDKVATPLVVGRLFVGSCLAMKRCSFAKRRIFPGSIVVLHEDMIPAHPNSDWLFNTPDKFWRLGFFAAPDERLVQLRVKHGPFSDPRGVCALNDTELIDSLLISKLGMGNRHRGIGTIISRVKTKGIMTWTCVFWPNEPTGKQLGWVLESAALKAV